MTANEKFQVDLSGLVNLLSRHLYSGPQVYIRELLQNGIDAITAAHQVDPLTPAEIRIMVDPATGTIEVTDTGVGLSSSQARELLATIGKSSKRDTELGFGRAEFLGQFGIGLLATFMIADSVTVISQARVTAGQPQPAPIVWVGNAQGTFTVTETTSAEIPEAIREGGSMVRLTARVDAQNWVSPETVLNLAQNYGELLPLPVLFAVKDGAHPLLWERLTRNNVPWQTAYATAAERNLALQDYAVEMFGFAPLGTIDISVPTLGISGVAFVLPQAVSPGSGQHTVYLKRMLLGTNIDNLLPEWAFFVRAILDTDSLSPTASREQLHDDNRLALAREAIGTIIKNWMREQLQHITPEVMEFLEIHNLAMRAVAAQDDEMLELIVDTLPYETTAGALTLREAERLSGGQLLYTSRIKDFKRSATVARAADLIVLNAGYAYDNLLIGKLQTELGWQLRELAAEDLTAALTTPPVEREMATAAQLTQARFLLESQDCDVLLRAFEPPTLPAILLQDRERDFHALWNQDEGTDTAADMWEGLLNSFDTHESKTRTLVLNDNAAVVQQLLGSDDSEIFAAGLTTLYISAIALTGEGLHHAETAALSAALHQLLQAALDDRAS